MDKATLFINESQISDEVKKHLGDHVEIQPYEDVASHVDKIRSSLNVAQKKVF